MRDVLTGLAGFFFMLAVSWMYALGRAGGASPPPTGAAVAPAEAALAEARRERDAVRRDVARLRADLAALNAGPGPRSAPADLPVEPAAPEPAQRTLEELRAAFAEAYRIGEKGPIVEILAAMSRLGEEAYPTLFDLTRRCTYPDPDGIIWMHRVSMSDRFLMARYDPAFLVWVVTNATPDRYLHWAAIVALHRHIPLSERDERRLAETIAADSTNSSNLIPVLSLSAGPVARETVLRFARSHASAAVRGSSILTMANWDTPETLRVLEEAARQDPNERVRIDARYSLLVLRPPETGVLVSHGAFRANGADGYTWCPDLAMNDIVIRCDSQPVRTPEDLASTTREGSVLEVLRDGTLVYIHLAAPLAGVDGRGVTRR
ncbi:MAG: hypothetical protein HY608_06760 [Planctomycetes bacterium]|nr:hypothetical protein [Planctomycetota bacterium]